MQQDSSNGSRTGSGENYGTIASTSEEGKRGDGSVDQLASSNQEEEEEEDGRSAYGSGDFDDLSKAGGSESEYDSRDYGFGEDDQSSNDSPTTGDGSASYTTGTGGKEVGAQGEEGGEANAGTATAGRATSAAELDELNSISSYGDDFADDDSIVPTAQSVNTQASSSGPAKKNVSVAPDNDNDDQAEQQKRVERHPDRAAAAIASSSPSPASEAGAREPASGGSGYSGSNANDRGNARAGEERRDRRRSSTSDKSNKNSSKNSDESDGSPASTKSKGSGVVTLGQNDKEGGATARPGAASSVQELEERLRKIDRENDSLREALERSATVGAGAEAAAKIEGSEDVGKELEILKSQVEAAKAMMLASLDEGEEKPERSLLELVLLAESRGYKQGEQNAEATRTASGEAKRRKSSSGYSATTTAAAVKAESIARAELEKRVESLERDLSRAGQESRAQSARAESLQRQLDGQDGGGGGRSGSGRGRRGSGGGGEVQAAHLDDVVEGVATADIMALKVKATQLVERLRQEKAARLKAERKTQRVARKVQVLSDHIEKLMMFLKHEATQKAKAHEQQRRLQKELELVKARSAALLRSNQGKDRAMTELREGSKILEDQLRLMDEKYMELRTKLDWTRTKAEKDVRRARAQASALRTKWAVLCGSGEGGESSLLDSMRVDSAPHLGHSSSAPPGMAQGADGGGTPGHADHGNNVRNHPKFGVVGSQQQQQHYHGGGPSRGGGSPPITRRGVVSGHREGARGGLAPNMPGPSLPVGRQQQLQHAGGNQRNKMPMPGYARGGGSRGGSPQGATTINNPGVLSAGTDPGGGLGLTGHAGIGRAGGSGGAQRPPWSEQGGGKGGGGDRQVPQQVLYA